MGKITEIVRTYGLMYEETWVNMVRFSDESYPLKFLKLLQHGFEYPCNEDELYTINKASEVAFYVLSQCGNPRLERAAFEVAVILIRKEAAREEAFDQVMFIRDVYKWCVTNQVAEDMLSAVVETIRGNEALAVEVLNSIIYGLYDGDISESNAHIVKQLVYHLRSARVIQEMETELYEVFTILDKGESNLLDDSVARELFWMFMNVKPIFYTKLPEGGLE